MKNVNDQQGAAPLKLQDPQIRLLLTDGWTGQAAEDRLQSFVGSLAPGEADAGKVLYIISRDRPEPGRLGDFLIIMPGRDRHASR